RFGVTPTPPARAIAWRLVIGGGLPLTACLLWFSAGWQREVRATMGMDVDITWFQPLIAALAALTFTVLLTIGRLIRLLTRTLIALLGRFIPAAVARVAGVLAVVLAVNVLANDVLFGRVVETVNTASSLANRTTSPGIVPPR